MENRSTKYSVFDIADWFLGKANSENKPLKHMKLQKLVYFAYGWYYAFFDKPLFHETIFAWKHGPVVKDLYDKYKSFKGTPITDFPESAPELDDCAETVVKHVWEVYAACSDMQLSEITHRPNSPWRRFYNPYEWSYEVIQPMSIRDYFKSIKKQKNDTR